MSQLFGMNEDNNIGIRVNDIKANNVYQKNEITGEYERLSSGGGGSGPGELPYYLKSNTIDIDSGTNGSELSATSLTIGDSSGNYVLDKTKLKMLDNLKTDVMDPALGLNVGPFVVGFNKNLNLFQRISTFKLGNNTTNVEYTDSYIINKSATDKTTILPIGYVLTNATDNFFLDKYCFKAITQIKDNIITPATAVGDLGNYIVSYNKSADVFERASNINIGKTTAYLTSIVAGSIAVSFGTSKLDLFQNKLRITFGGIVYELSKEDIDSVNKLRQATLISPTEANKMIVFDPVTKIYNYAAIPSGAVTGAIESISSANLNFSTTIKNVVYDNTTNSFYYANVSNPRFIRKVVSPADFVRVTKLDFADNTFSENSAIYPQPATPFKVVMNSGDKLTIITASPSTRLQTMQWYVMKLTNNSAGNENSKFKFDIFPSPLLTNAPKNLCTQEYKIHVRRIAHQGISGEITATGTGGTSCIIDQYSLMFCITNDTDITYSATTAGKRIYEAPEDFLGTILVECITSYFPEGQVV